MKKIFVALVVLLSLTAVSNSFAFLDYLFSGSASRDAYRQFRSWGFTRMVVRQPRLHVQPLLFRWTGSPRPAGRSGSSNGPASVLNSPLLITTRPEGGSPYQYGQQQQYAPQQAPQPQMQYGYGGQQPQQQMYQQQQGHARSCAPIPAAGVSNLSIRRGGIGGAKTGFEFNAVRRLFLRG